MGIDLVDSDFFSRIFSILHSNSRVEHISLITFKQIRKSPFARAHLRTCLASLVDDCPCSVVQWIVKDHMASRYGWIGFLLTNESSITSSLS